MDVTVKKTCGRCGKITLEEMEVSAASELQERDAQCSDAEDALPELLNRTLSTTHPDIIVAVRQEDGVYSVKTLRELCHVSKATRNRGCQTRVGDLLAEVFKTDAPKKLRKKRTKKNDQNTESLTDSAEVEVDIVIPPEG